MVAAMGGPDAAGAIRLPPARERSRAEATVHVREAGEQDKANARAELAESLCSVPAACCQMTTVIVKLVTRNVDKLDSRRPSPP